jgi:hypothetical protein
MTSLAIAMASAFLPRVKYILARKAFATGCQTLPYCKGVVAVNLKQQIADRQNIWL